MYLPVKTQCHRRHPHLPSSSVAEVEATRARAGSPGDRSPFHSLPARCHYRSVTSLLPCPPGASLIIWMMLCMPSPPPLGIMVPSCNLYESGFYPEGIPREIYTHTCLSMALPSSEVTKSWIFLLGLDKTCQQFVNQSETRTRSSHSL